MFNVTLQFNLSARDIPYARLNIPHIVKMHCATVDEKIAIVDCCRPQRTKFVYPPERFSEPGFSQRQENICAIAEELKKEGYIDKIIYLYSDDPLLKVISRKYLRNIIHETHDSGGCGLMAYLAAFEVVNTRYILHYDADILLYQFPGYDWSVEARYLMDEDPNAIAARPRICPPFIGEKDLRQTVCTDEGRSFIPVKSVRSDSWFSTRCFLMDRKKLFDYLPLVQGELLIRTLITKAINKIFPVISHPISRRQVIEEKRWWPKGKLLMKGLYWRYVNQLYPLPPEAMFCLSIGNRGGRCLNLDSEKAWLLHPNDKSFRYLRLLPQILQKIRQNQPPLKQRGDTNINISAWENFLDNNK